MRPAQTVRFLIYLETKPKDFTFDTGTELDPKGLAHVVGSVLDEDASGRLEDAGVDATSYELVQDFIEKREV